MNALAKSPKQATWQQDKMGSWYIAPSEVAAILGVDRTTLYHWIGNGISVLSGEKPIRRRFPRWGTHGRKERYWQNEQVERIAKALAELGKRTNDHHSVAEAAKKEGISSRGILARIENGKLEKETLIHVNKDGLPCPRIRISADSLKAYKTSHSRSPIPVEKMSVAEAADYLTKMRDRLRKEHRMGRRSRPIAENTILGWLKWCSWLGKPLAKHEGKVLTQDGQLRDGYHVERAEIKEIARRTALPPREVIYRDAQGEWLTERQAKRAHCNISTTLLQRHRNKKHPSLDGDILSAQLIDASPGMSCRVPRIWVYLKADVGRIAANSPGKGRWRTQEESAKPGVCMKHGPDQDQFEMMPEVTTAKLGWQAIRQLEKLIAQGKVAWLSVFDAAKVIGCAEKRVLELVQEGHLHDNGKTGKAREISAADCALYRAKKARPQSGDSGREEKGPASKNNPDRPTAFQIAEKLRREREER